VPGRQTGAKLFRSGKSCGASINGQGKLKSMQLDVFPGFGIPIGTGHWRLLIAGAVRQVYLPTVRKRMLIRLLGNIIDATDEQLASEEFVRRVTPFVADGAGKVDVRVVIGDRSYPLRRRTRRSGLFSQWLQVPVDQIDAQTETDEFGRQFFRPRIVCQTEAGTLERVGEMWLAPESGWSVISDVDDTIKESDIADRKQLLTNTFLRTYRPVAGMSGLYRDWASSGMHFHYVSSSPSQLLHPLRELRDDSGFPGGSLHLRNFRLRNHVLQKVARIRRSGKSAVIRHLVSSQPLRRFLLVGDSGESDLSIYAKVAKKYPGSVAGIFIRTLGGNEMSQERFDKCQNAAYPTPCATFTHASQLQQLARSAVECGVKPG